MKLKKEENFKMLNSKSMKSFSKDVEKYVEILKNISKSKESTLSTIRKWENIFFIETNRLLSRADKIITKERNNNYIKEIKKHFREILKDWIYKGEIVKRGYEKPRGYPGDYFTLEMIYDEKDISNNPLGMLFDKYLLKDSYVTAVRNRKEKMKILLRNFILHSSNLRKLRFLNIASGGARDVREFLINNKEFLINKNIEMVLVDQDKEALSYAKNKIKLINSPVNINYLNENISSFFRNQDIFRKKLRRFDLIYSIGLIDYISDFLLEELIRFCFELLNDGGKLFLAVKNTKAYKSLASDWFCDWNFYLRDQSDLILLINNTLRDKEFKVQLIRGFDNHISFVSILKE